MIAPTVHKELAEADFYAKMCATLRAHGFNEEAEIYARATLATLSKARAVAEVYKAHKQFEEKHGHEPAALESKKKAS